MKNKIAVKLGESLDNIIFKRGNIFGTELVEDDLTFKLANVFNMMNIHIERGTPTRQGYKKLSFSLANYYNADWTTLQNPEEIEKPGFRPPHDHEFFTFTELFK